MNAAIASSTESQVTLQQAKREFVRAKSLLDQNMVSEGDYDARKLALDSAAQTYNRRLAEIEVAPFEQAFPKTRPTDLVASDEGWGGYALFQKSCASCHAINGEGGKVGPDLNVPRSIVEYRPIPEIRAYIRNPEATRYTSMPAHPGLSEDDLDALIAYFSAMSQRKQDPRKQDEL